MKYKLNIEELKEIYLVSNTASYLLDKFSNEESIQQITQDNDTRSLINDFLVIAKSEIDKIEDLVKAYSLYISIILKDDNETFHFLKNEGLVNFEWFIELRSIYFSRQKPFDIFKIDNLFQEAIGKTQFIESSETINTQIIEFI